MAAHKFTWLNLPHLPDVPQHFVDRAFKLANPETNPDYGKAVTDNPFPDEWFARKVTYNGIESTTRHLENLVMGKDWEDWVKANIIKQFNDTGAKLSVSPTDVNAPVHGAHVDNYSKIRLYYLLERGGDNVETVFYLRPGSPLVYDDHKNYVNPNGEHIPAYCDDQDSMIEIERAQFPLRKWIALNGLVMHSVVNLTGPRLILSVAVDPEYFDFTIVSN